MALDFGVDLDRLSVLQTRLVTLQAELASGPAGTSASRSSLDPRADVSSSLVRANPDSIAPFAYGLLHEAAPLGYAHEQVSHSLATLVSELHDLIEAMITHAQHGVSNYTEADASVLAAITAAGGGVEA